MMRLQSAVSGSFESATDQKVSLIPSSTIFMHTRRTDFEQSQKERIEVVPGDSYRCQTTFPLSLNSCRNEGGDGP